MTFLPKPLIAGLVAVVFLLMPGAHAMAQFADAEADAAAAGDAESDDPSSTLLSADQLNTLVAPVALYPDELLAVVLPAATNPIQVVEAQRFLDQQKSNPDLKPNEDWDPAVIALLNYPQVIKQMNDDLTWTQDLGNAVMDQQADVMNAIQAARAAAADAGYLQSNDQQVVVNDNDNIVIQSAEPDVVYVPSYDPAPIVNNTYVNYPPPVYSDPYPSYYAPAATFFAGAIVGATFAYAFDWDDDNIDIDCCDHGDIDIDNDINIDRGDVNIGSGNVNIDKSKIQNKFNGDRKAGADGKMKWSSQKARQKSDLPRKSQATRANRPSSDSIKKQLSGGAGASALPAGKGANAQNRVKSSKAAKAQSQRGQASLSQTKKPQQQLRQNASNKQQLQRKSQQQRPQKQLQNRQLKQKQGGAFQQMPSQKQAKAQSNRGNRSLNKGGHSKPKKTQRRN
jgi:hypothetical protein